MLKKSMFIVLLAFSATQAHAAGKSIRQVCTEYANYYGDVYNFAMSEDADARKGLQRAMRDLKVTEDKVNWDIVETRHDESKQFLYMSFANRNDTYSRGQYQGFIDSCTSTPSGYIPSWNAIVKSGYVNREEAANAKSPFDGLENAPGMRHQDGSKSIFNKNRNEKNSNPCHNNARDSIPAEDLIAQEKAGTLPEVYRETYCAPKKKTEDLNGAQKALKSLNLPYNW